MSFNLPGMYLYYLSRDNLAPEEYERIISPHAAWARICREYEFDDSHNTSRYLINMREREQRFSPDQPRPGGIREKEKLEKLVFSGDVVMLSDMYGPARLFYINGEGQLMSADPHAFRFEGAAKIIKAFDDGVKCRNYQRTGGKPRSTKSPMKVRPSVSELPVPKAFGTINSKAAGRLLAAGGVYNQNPEMFADTAKKLGGDAAEGFDQVLNENTAGAMLVAGILLGAKRGNPVSKLEKLKSISAKKRESIGRHSATSSLQSSKLNDYYRQAEKYGQGGIKELENGRFRFYGTMTPARTSGEMAGARLVREWDPKSGQTRTWYETVDHSGNIRSVAPKPVVNDKNHRIFDTNGNYQGRR